MSTDQKIIKNRLGLLELANQLGNVYRFDIGLRVSSYDS